MHESAEKYCLTQVSRQAAFSSCSAVGNLFMGKDHMKHHEPNQKSRQRVQKFIEQVHNAASRIASPRADSVFVGQCLSVVHCPPALLGGCSGNSGIKPFGTGVDTHTAPRGGARVESLNRYLKGLRNKRKKHRKSSAKRAREKGRCRKTKMNT